MPPSSINSQPWYFTHADELFHAYCVKQGPFKVKMLGEMNRIDMGIALAHLYVANPGSFRFFKANGVEERKGYTYTGSFTLGPVDHFQSEN